MAKLRIPDLQYVRRAQHEYAIQQQKKSSEMVIKGNYNQPIPVNRESGMYSFRSSAKGKFVLHVSDLREDWPELQSKALTEVYVRQWARYAVKWLENHGWGPVEVQIVRGFVQPGQFSSSDVQHDIRQAITRDWLAQGKINRNYFENSGDTSGWKGI